MLPPTAINEGPPVKPRASATVLLIRGRKPWELLLMRRPGGADFAPDAYVFPGGAVHADDSEWADPVAAAAVREVFEEVGILLARKQGRFARDADSEHIRLARKQRRFARDADSEQIRMLIAGGQAFGAALGTLGLDPANDRLVPFARWVTPAQLKRRFDATFFLAQLPAGQTVRPQAGEVVDWLWIAPEKALNDPAITLVYATRAVLESVAGDADAADLFSRARRLEDVPIVEPRMVQTEKGWEVIR